MQACVFGLVEDTHAAATELFNSFVVGNALAGHWRKSYVGEERGVNEAGDGRQAAGLGPKLAGTAWRDAATRAEPLRLLPQRHAACVVRSGTCRMRGWRRFGKAREVDHRCCCRPRTG